MSDLLEEVLVPNNFGESSGQDILQEIKCWNFEIKAKVDFSRPLPNLRLKIY